VTFGEVVGWFKKNKTKHKGKSKPKSNYKRKSPFKFSYFYAPDEKSILGITLIHFFRSVEEKQLI